MDLWPLLENELIQYRELMDQIKRKLMLYETECLKLISQINGKKFDDCQNIFDSLYSIQQEIATALYKYEFPLNESLASFVYHFDRDDVYSRKYWYKKINEGLTWPKE